MCGILGLLTDNEAPPMRESLLAALGHRGPDDCGVTTLRFGERVLSLGHTRLAILDLSPAGRQPMCSRDGRWNLIFNGEIYNHRELRGQLGGPFRGHSDTETLVEALAAWGIDATLPRLNGMFAFAAVDTLNGRLHLARDPFGIKPLYYASTARGGFAFASEIRGLLALGAVDAEVDPHGLQAFLTLRYTPSPRTLWKGVNRLAPGHLLTLNRDGAHCTGCYLEPEPRRLDDMDADEAVEAYHSTLRAAVQRQLLSDVPVGVLLSGGVDSALVCALAMESSTPLRTFTVGFQGRHREDELSAAADTARWLGTDNISLRVASDDLWEAFPRAVDAVEEPLGTPSVLAMWHLVERAKRDVTVVLTGQGSDEPWGGYRRYQGEILRHALPLHGRLGALSALAPLAVRLPEFVERGLRSMGEMDPARRFLEAYTLFRPRERRSLTGSDDDGGALARIAAWLGKQSCGDREPVERMMAVDTRMNLADDLLLYGDKISMAFSLETRVPMLDLEVVRFVESLPRSLRVKWRLTKVIHKRMAEKYLPAMIVHRPKLGFPVPFDTWIKGRWRERAADLLLDPGAPHLDSLDRGSINRLWEEHQRGHRDRSRQLFALMSLAYWWQGIRGTRLPRLREQGRRYDGSMLAYSGPGGGDPAE